jgi:hypothetical protein
MAAQPVLVNGLPVPALLLRLIEEGRWTHPGDTMLRRAIPFLSDPMDWMSLDWMRSESSGHLADDPRMAELFHEYRGSRTTEKLDLPWRDVERSFLILVCRYAGDDTAVALDFRTSMTDPRVIATYFINEPTSGGVWWREAAPTFSELVRLLGLAQENGWP